MSFTLAQAAIDAVGRQVAKRGVEGTSLRLGVRGGGCAGFSYVIEFHDGPPKLFDVVHDLTATDGSAVRVLVDKKSLALLDGATLEWEETLMRQGFRFDNPNAVSACGCGESFTLRA